MSLEQQRFTAEDVETWRRDGVTLVRDFFTPEEVAAVRADFEQVFGRTAGAEQAMDKKKAGEIGRFNGAQFRTLEAVPFPGAPALNLIGVHPALIAFAKAALNTDAVHLYQCQAWAKFTGDADYDQPFHCDYSNHTLTVPSEDAASNSVTILNYFTDVTDAHGAMRYVTRPDSDRVAGPEATLDFAPGVQAQLQRDLMAHERSSASPAGTAIPYSIDVYHRGANLTAPNGHRYAVMACFKRAGDESIGFHAWAFHNTKPWAELFERASPEQLACFGVKLPGDPFWTETTLARAQARYPRWDLTPYRVAASRP
ncbi:phytanoyl-CoA dioxygenase family protein [Phenylobacterium aquaticum]|uniref:phytanoyl-CoA dioxygenase family protein n=1 Tax=Phenylobacterium aquaticum TaxID=1763816 RepID=UPI0026F19D76|nr:phytanoyl-CoA dioxygenase family protein [Phenylobacterium aquaticum]